MATITIIGGGAWGKALYHALSQNHQVAIVSRQTLPEHFNQCTLQEANQHSIHFIVAIGYDYLKSFFEQNTLRKDAKILMATKGIGGHNGIHFISQIMTTYFPAPSLAFLGGPSFATEIMQNLPCAVEIHSISLDLAKEFQKFFPSFMQTYINDDVIGGQIAGAYKNVIAIASGICVGLELGQNAKAALLARGLVEMAYFGKFFGAKMQTFLGLSGAGDLFLSANSTLSRNYRVGLALTQGKNLASITEELGEIAEGIKTSAAITFLSQQHNIHTPIAQKVNGIIEGKDTIQSFQKILTTGR